MPRFLAAIITLPLPATFVNKDCGIKAFEWPQERKYKRLWRQLPKALKHRILKKHKRLTYEALLINEVLDEIHAT